MAASSMSSTRHVFHTTPNAPREELDRSLPDHLEHQIRLEKSGIRFAAGPMMKPDGTPAGGLIVIRAKDCRGEGDRRFRPPSTRPACSATRCGAGPSTKAVTVSA